MSNAHFFTGWILLSFTPLRRGGESGLYIVFDFGCWASGVEVTVSEVGVPDLSSGFLSESPKHTSENNPKLLPWALHRPFGLGDPSFERMMEYSAESMLNFGAEP